MVEKVRRVYLFISTQRAQRSNWNCGQGPVASLDLQPLFISKHKRDNEFVAPKSSEPDYKRTGAGDHEVGAATRRPCAQPAQHTQGQLCYVCFQRSGSVQNAKILEASTAHGRRPDCSR